MRNLVGLAALVSLLSALAGCAGSGAHQREVWQQQRSQQGQDELSRETQHSAP